MPQRGPERAAEGDADAVAARKLKDRGVPKRRRQGSRLRGREPWVRRITTRRLRVPYRRYQWHRYHQYGQQWYHGYLKCHHQHHNGRHGNQMYQGMNGWMGMLAGT